MVKRNGYWKTHPDKELQALLFVFHEAGWRILNPPKYYKAYCGCEKKHKVTVALTPSGSQYRLNKLKWLQRQPCYPKNKEARA